MQKKPALLTIKDSSKLLGVSTKTLRRWEKSGKIKAVRTVGGHRRFWLEDLNNLKKKKPQRQIRNLISINTAAKNLGVSSKTIRRWEKEGKIESVRTVGGHRRFTTEAIQQVKNKKYQPVRPVRKISVPPREIIKVIGQPLPSTPQEAAALNLFNLKLISFVLASSLLIFIANYSWEIGYMFNRLTGISIPGISEEELVSIPGEGDWLSILSAQKGVYEGDVDIIGSLDVSSTITTDDLVVSSSASIYSLSVTSGLVVSDNEIINSSGKIPALNGDYFEDLNGENIINVDAHHLGGAAASSFLRSDESDTAEAAINFTSLPANNNVSGGPVYINPGSSTSDYTLFGVAVNNTQKFRIDAEGDVSIAGNINVDGTMYGSVSGTINPGFTTGSIVFQGASGLTEDNPNFFWNDTDNKLGIGTDSPTSKLHVKTDTSNLLGKSALIVDQMESEDIFTASASGAIKYVIDNDGNIFSVAGAKWQPLTDSTTALNIANASGTEFVTFDTTNSRVGIGTTSPTNNMTFYKDSFDQPADMVWNQTFDEEISDFDSISPTWDKEVGAVVDFDSETDADGDMNSTPAAAHDETNGIEITFDDTNVAYGTMDLDAVDQTTGAVSFWANANDVTLATGESVNIAYCMDGGNVPHWYVKLTKTATGYRLDPYYRDDDNVNNLIGSGYEISGATWYHVLLMFEASSGVGTNDGFVYFLVDGVLRESITNADNDTRDWDYGRFGMNYSAASTTSGSYYIDTIKIDPVGAPFASKLAVKNGSYGLALPTDDAESRNAQFTGPTAETAGTVEFWLNPNSVAMAANDNILLVSAWPDPVAYATFNVEMEYDSGYTIWANYRNDGADYIATSAYAITDDWHLIRIVWAAATGVGNDDGYLYLYIDGELKEALSGLDNDTRVFDTMLFRSHAYDAGTYGIIYMDDYSWSDQTGISNFTTSSFGIDPSYLRFYEHADIRTDGQLSIDADEGVVFNSAGADIDFRIEGDADQNLFFVDAGNGRIGIGTASPGANLAVESSTNPAIRIGEGGVTNRLIDIKVDTTNSIAYIDSSFYSGGAFPLVFKTGSNEKVRIDTSGRVGIGRTSTANLLEVEGTASKTAAGDWLANSDIRIKTDVEGLDNALDIIDLLRPVKFKYTDEYMAEHPSLEDRYYYNFIAQEFQEIFPDSVQDSGENGYLQLDAYNVRPYLVAAMQELNTKVEVLELESESGLVLGSESDNEAGDLEDNIDVEQEVASMSARMDSLETEMLLLQSP
jgi:excisionase family DNA binding protein